MDGKEGGMSSVTQAYSRADRVVPPSARTSGSPMYSPERSWTLALRATPRPAVPGVGRASGGDGAVRALDFAAAAVPRQMIFAADRVSRR